MSSNKKNKVNFIVITGPTATGKTKIAVDAAYQYNGEIISADSRQIYRGMDIGTGKDLDKYDIKGNKIKYHLIDILDPTEDYSVYQFQRDFLLSYEKIKAKKKLPIICGGTGLYIESVLLDYNIPKVTPNIELRKSLENNSKAELINKLKKINLEKFDSNYHTSKRRLIRTIEILSDNSLNQVEMNRQGNNKYTNTLIIGIQIERENILKLIKARLLQRLQEGMIQEVEGLLKQGLHKDRLHYFGLEYRYIGQYLFDKIDYDTMLYKINININKFSKRQMTFFRRMEKRGLKIHWMKKNNPNLNNLINNFLHS